MSGIKHDHDKLPWHLLPGDALEEVVKVLEFGQRKYSARNWEYGMSWHRPFAAACRHMWAWWRGEDNDPETGLSHMAHLACCSLFLLAFVLRKVGYDDRPIEKGKSNAAQEGFVQQGRVGEHQERDGLRPTAEAGDRDRAQQGGQVQAAQEVGHKKIYCGRIRCCSRYVER